MADNSADSYKSLGSVAPTYLHPLWAWLLVLGVALTPALALLRDGSAGAVFYLLCFASLVVLASPTGRQQWRSSCNSTRWTPLWLSAAVFLATIIAAHVLQGNSPGTGLEKTLRFVLAVPVMLALRTVHPSQMRWAQWGIICTLLVMACLLIFPPATLGTRPDTVQFSRYNTVEFGNLVCLYATLTLFFCAWPTTRFERAELAVKVLVAVMAMYGFLLSQTRTGWLAIPVFVLIALVLLGRTARWLRGPVIGAVVAGLVIIVAFSDAMQDRFILAVDEYQQCINEPLVDSSICNRVQLAHAAWNLFLQEPLAGVGDGNAYRDALAEQSRQGVISDYVASNFGEPHNDFLFYLSAYGLLGFVGAVLFIYLTPIGYFLRAFVRSQQRDTCLAAAMGLALCIGFAAFGLAEMMFRGMRTASLYAVWVAYFLALAEPFRAGMPTNLGVNWGTR